MRHPRGGAHDGRLARAGGVSCKPAQLVVEVDAVVEQPGSAKVAAGVDLLLDLNLASLVDLGVLQSGKAGKGSAAAPSPPCHQAGLLT